MKRYALLVAILICLAFSAPSFAATFYVTPTGGGSGAAPEAPTTLQTALTSARNNGESDTIRVAQGTYVGNFYHNPVSGENFDLTLEGGWSADFNIRTIDPTNTILDGNHAGRVFAINKSTTSAIGNVTVEGFTIRNGFVAGSGAGVYIMSYPPGTVTLSRNIIENNECSDTGGGFWISNDESVNRTGGPIHIIGNSIRNNVGASGTGGTGGGGRVYTLGGFLLSNNLIYGNRVGGNPYFYGSGGGLYVSVVGGPVQIINNTVTANTAYTDGGGVLVGRYGLPGYPAQEVQMSNNIARDNSATTGNGADLYADIDTTAGNTLGVAHNDYHDLYVPAGRLAPTLVNNIDLEPRFVNVTDPSPANWDLRIQPDSPCLDAGDNAAPDLPAMDITGNARVIDGDGDGNAIVDMGAYERNVIFRIYRVTPTSDSDCGDSECDLQSALNAAAADNTNSYIRIAQGTYTGNFTYSGAGGENYALVLEGGWSTDFSTRTVDPTNTILDGGGTGRVLTVDNRSNDTFGDVAVEGFTIRNGLSLGVSGGGLMVASLPPGTITINRNIIEDNETDYSAGGLIAINREPTTSNGGPMVVSNNIMRNNRCGTGIAAAYGGAAYLYNADTLTMFNNLIYSNQARALDAFEGSVGGLVVVTYAGTVNMVNNTITRNHADTATGGIHLVEAGDAWVVSDVSLHNNIIRNNTYGVTSAEEDILNMLSASQPASGNALTIANNNYGSLTNDAAAVIPTLSDNINADPLFVNVIDPDSSNWDLRLRYGSPCMDTGNTGASGIPTIDFLGNNRVQDGDGDGTAVADMGAYELGLGRSTTEGTFGTEVALSLPTGGFGASKSKVYLEVTDPVSAKTKLVAFQVINWGDALVQARWKKKVAQGEYPLVVQLKGKNIAPIHMGMFRIQIPVITGFEPVERRGAVGDNIILNGRFFGSGKPKVIFTYLDGSGKQKKCKVLTTPPPQMDPATGTSTLTFVVPKVTPGDYTVEIVSKIGGSGSFYVFEVLPSE